MNGKRIDQPAGIETMSAIPAYQGPSNDPIQTRAAAPADLVAGIARGLSHLAHLALVRIVRWHHERTTCNALLRLSDHTLRDIGVAREDIPSIARSLRACPPQAVGGRWLHARRERQRELRELMAYSDRELDEIGVRRCDIPALLRGPELAHAA